MELNQLRQFIGQLAVWAELRLETRQHMARLDWWILVILTVMLALIAASRFDRFKDAIVAAAIFGAFSPYLMARQDLLIHRPAPAVAAIERELQIKGWENHYKPMVKPLTNFLPVLDVLAATPIVLLFAYSLREASRYLNSNLFWWLCLLFFAGGWVMISLVLLKAGKLMNLTG